MNLTHCLRTPGPAAALVAALVAMFVAAAGASAGSALSRKQADAIALRTLRPQADKGDVILFGLPAPLPKGLRVAPADPPRSGIGRVRRPATALSEPAWLYWLDREPGALFSHPSEYLLVDDRTGRVLTRKKVGWYPAVDAKRPPFLASAAGYGSARYRVFARVQRKISSATAVRTAARPSEVPAGAFKDDCLLMAGGFADPVLERDFPPLQRWAASVGLRAFYATPDGPTRTSPGATTLYDKQLRANVKELVEKQGCKDVMIYLAGHGQRDSDEPIVETDPTTAKQDGVDVTVYGGITAHGIERVLESFKTTTFKLKISSCYSGRFVDELTKVGKPRFDNLLIVEVSSQRNRYGYASPQWERAPENPEHVTWFLNQNLTGLRTWAASDDEVASSAALGGSLLANALERAFVLGRDANRSIREHGSIPQIATNFLPLAFTRSSWRHEQGSSIACAEVKSEPRTAVNVAVSTNASVPPQPTLKTVQTGANGLAVASFRIFRAADYAFGAAARQRPRTSKAAPARITIPPPPQQPPAGSLVCPAP